MKPCRTDTRSSLSRRIAAALALLTMVVTFAFAEEVAKRDVVNSGLGPVPAEVVRATPAASWHSFLELSRAGRFKAAAQCLDLTEVAEKEQAEVGAKVAEQLYKVLQAAGAKLDAVTSDTSEGPKVGGEPTNVVVAFRFSSHGVDGEVWLRRTLDSATGEQLWLVTRRTVSSAPIWYRAVVEGQGVETEELNQGLSPDASGIDRSNPRAAVVGFLTACRDGAFDKAAHFLDLGAYSPAQQPDLGPQLARRLKIVLDRTFWVNPEAISNDPAGVPEAGLEPEQERLTTLDLKGQKVDILLTRVHIVGGAVWVFDRSTVAAIGPLYGEYGFGWLGDHLPAFFFSLELGEVQLWQWIGMALLLAVGWMVATLVARPVLGALRHATKRTAVSWDDGLIEALDGPLRLGLLALLLTIGIPWLRLSAPAQHTTGVLLKLLVVLFLAWIASRWVSTGARVLQQSAVTEANQVARSFIPVFSRIAIVLVWVLAVVVALDQVGVRVVGLVAGLGIGGLAIAFAAQKTIENLFGSIAIAADRPFQVGDFVKIGDIVGTIEDVGLRSTRIRTLARTMVTIPNGSLISDRVENFAARDRFLFNPTIGVLYSSTKAQLEFVLDETKRMLYGRDDVFKEVVRVRIDGFGASSIDIGIFTWILATDFNEFKARVESINFAIYEIVERSGTGFAFPSRTIYTARDDGVDEDKERAVAELVEQRREAGELWVPEPPAGDA